MAWNYSGGDEEKILIYDLRQTYVEIVGMILKQIMLSRQQNNFTAYFLLLDDLHTEINHKLKKEENERYYLKLKEAKKVIDENRGAYLGKSRDSQEVLKIRNALKDLEMYLKVLMEKHKMFGAKEEPELL